MQLGDHLHLLKNKHSELQTRITPFLHYLKANALYWPFTGALAISGHVLPAGILALLGGTTSGALGIMFCEDLFLSKDSNGRNVWDKYHAMNRKLETAQQLLPSLT